MIEYDVGEEVRLTEGEVAPKPHIECEPLMPAEVHVRGRTHPSVFEVFSRLLVAKKALQRPGAVLPVRLQVFKHGAWRLHTGLADLKPQRGFWGGGGFIRESADRALFQLAQELLAQVEHDRANRDNVELK